MSEIRKMNEEALYASIAKEAGEEVANQIVYGKEQQDSVWVENTMQRLLEQFSLQEIKTIRQRCQCGYAMDEKIRLVRELYESASSYEEFANCKRAREAGLFYEEGTLYLQFLFCPCPMLAQVEKLSSSAWCECTTGYSKVLFETVFGCPVSVELQKSIKMGDERCLMTILPKKELF